jgi:nucleoside-diphosphate-sugar epimerase
MKATKRTRKAHISYLLLILNIPPAAWAGVDVYGHRIAAVKIVVAGGTGFIGEPLVQRFVARGDDVAVLTRNPAKVRAGRGLQWDGRTQVRGPRRPRAPMWSSTSPARTSARALDRGAEEAVSSTAG